jgi:diguanylate cyclase (GGDEF)-like protein
MRTRIVEAGQAPVDLDAQCADELEWLLEVVSATAASVDNEDVLARLIGASVQHFSCDVGALLVPAKRLNLVRSATTCDPRALDTLRSLEAPLLNWALRNNRPLLANPPASRAATHGGFRVLALPIQANENRASGVLVFLRSPALPEFNRKHLSVGKHLSRQVTTVLERQFDLATGLYSRGALQREVRKWASDATAADTHCLLYIDVDRLHVINETLGFDAGDRVIGCVAELLESARLPPGAVAARIGGGTFAIALPRTSAQTAAGVAERLQQHLAGASRSVLGEQTVLSASCGIRVFANAETEFSHAFTLAELACKTAKDHGRGRIEIYDDGDNSMTHRYADVLTLGRLQQVLRSNSLTLYAQKIMPLQRREEPEGYELLLRALDEDHGNRAPASLFSAARRYQMESAIDLWVLEHALADAGQYRTELLAGRISLSINISAQSLVDETFLERARRWIQRSRVLPRLLTFEITESVAVTRFDRALTFIHAMRGLGCRFALDDFGTGVNSLKYLKRLEVDRVKIDGSFVTDLFTNVQSVATVRAIVGLTRELNIETVAEYAENPETIARLRDLGVDYAQGYGVEHPRPFGEVLEGLRTAQSASLHRLQLEI